jgi:hypothetical protein
MMNGHDEPTLAEPHRRLHRALIDAVVTAGMVPAMENLADRLNVAPEQVQTGLRALAAVDYLSLDSAGNVTCLYPFSSLPTDHVLVIGERRRYAMCSLDALGVAAMLGEMITVEARCAHCGEPIRLRVCPRTIDASEPATTAVVVRREADTPASEACCPFTVFACNGDHARRLAARVPTSEVLPLQEALTLGEAIFGDLLAETLPVRRRRSSDVPSAHRSTSTS